MTDADSKTPMTQRPCYLCGSMFPCPTSSLRDPAPVTCPACTARLVPSDKPNAPSSKRPKRPRKKAK